MRSLTFYSDRRKPYNHFHIIWNLIHAWKIQFVWPVLSMILYIWKKNSDETWKIKFNLNNTQKLYLCVSGESFHVNSHQNAFNLFWFTILQCHCKSCLSFSSSLFGFGHINTFLFHKEKLKRKKKQRKLQKI